MVSMRASPHQPIFKPMLSRRSANSATRASLVKKLLSSNSTALTPQVSTIRRTVLATRSAGWASQRPLTMLTTAQKLQKNGQP